MKLKFYMSHIGEQDFEFKNKFELFNFYYNNEGSIEGYEIPLYYEYIKKYKPEVNKYTIANDCIIIDLNASDEAIQSQIKNARSIRVESNARLENIYNIYRNEEI